LVHGELREIETISMSTTERQKEILIRHLTNRNIRLEEENDKLHNKITGFRFMSSKIPKDKLYTFYLQQSLMELEMQYADLQSNYLKLAEDQKACRELTAHFDMKTIEKSPKGL
jgi:hypothetical protein